MSHKRCVAQLGRALRSGRRGRRFKSCRIDYKKTDTARYLFFYNQNERTGSVTSSVPNARSGAEGPRGPGDLGFGPTGAERRVHEVRGTSALDRPERSADRRFKGICFFCSQM